MILSAKDPEEALIDKLWADGVRSIVMVLSIVETRHLRR
jgi:hypothetical protein